MPVQAMGFRKRKKQIQKEFKDWKNMIIDIVKKKSAVMQYPDGSYSFAVPPKLVKIVWMAMIKDMVAQETNGNAPPVFTDDNVEKAKQSINLRLKKEAQKIISNRKKEDVEDKV